LFLFLFFDMHNFFLYTTERLSIWP
jgi:hypothetical protein